MSRNTLSIDLQETMRSDMDAGVASGQDEHAIEYVRDRVRKDQTDSAKACWRLSIEKGLSSSAGTSWTEAGCDEPFAFANGEFK